MAPYIPQDPEREPGRRDLIVAVGVILVAVTLNFAPDTTQEVIASRIRGSALAPFIGLQTGIANSRLRALRNEDLQAGVDSLIAELTSRTTLEEENRRLRGLLGLAARLGPGWRPAQVLRPGTQGSRSTFLLDVGTDDGVRARSPVITREGLAGMITDIQAGAATGMDWTHPDFRASAMTVDGLSSGLIQARQGAFREEDRLLLTGTPFTDDLQPGMVIVTSGLGGVFPRGIQIGRVVELYQAEGSWQKSYWVEPFVQVASLTHVLVATTADPLEQTAAPEIASIYAEDGYLTVQERRFRDELLADSLRMMQDSVRTLRGLLGFPGGGGG